MGLVNCRDCGGTISTNANMCPHCGTINTIQNELLYQQHLEYEKALDDYEMQMLINESAALKQAGQQNLILMAVYVFVVLLGCWFVGTVV